MDPPFQNGDTDEKPPYDLNSKLDSICIGMGTGIGTRGPMNQAQFDEKYTYSKPHMENEMIKQSKKFFRRFYDPFTSCKRFQKFLYDFFPILHWLPNYNWKTDLTPDIIGGITVGVMQVPQGIAYALLAKQPAINGLYTSLIPPLIYMFFGTSRHSSLGTFAIASLMVGLSVERFTVEEEGYTVLPNATIRPCLMGDPLPTPTEISCAITFTMGVICLLMGILRLQFLTTYLSDQLITGFTVGSSVHVLVSQLKTLLGIRGLPRHSGPFYLFRHLYDLALAIPKANLVCCGISAVSIVILYCGKELINPIIKKKTKSNIPIPWELVIVVLSTVFVAVTGVDLQNSVQTVEKIPMGLPEVKPPPIHLIPKVLPDAISITIVGVSVWLSVSKITLVAVGAGCTTQLSILFASVLVFLVVFFLGFLLETLPMAALAAIICVALQGMFRKFSDLGELWKVSKIDCLIWIVSCVSTIILDVSTGLLFSVCFALFTTILREQYPKWHLLAAVKGTQDFRDVQRYAEVVYFKGICIFRFDAPLLFYNVECFKRSIEKAYTEWQRSQDFGSNVSEDRTNGKNEEQIVSRHFIIDCSGFTFIDLMGVSALKEVFSDMRKQETLVYFANAKAPVRDMFQKCKFFESVPKENFYPTMLDATSIARQRQVE